MSFRGRLRIFFAIIVIVPMVAVALVLFTLNDQSERGKADAAIAAGLRTAIALYGDAGERARPALARVARDPRLRTLLADGLQKPDTDRLDRILAANPRVVEIDVEDVNGARAGATRREPGGIASAAAPLRRGDRDLGTLSVSVTEPRDFVRDVKRFSGMEATVTDPGRGGRPLAATIPGASPRAFGHGSGASDAEIRGDRVRGRSARLGNGGERVEVAVFQSSEKLEADVASNRRLIFGVLGLFFLVALISSAFISRALQAQIQTFLVAARRVASGDFEYSVPTEGRDEFSQLGEEFNSMSEQLAAKIEEVERKRTELEETIRRVGDAFAAGLDRQGVVELAVETAVDACEAEAGRLLPLDSGVLRPVRVGEEEPELDAALEAAERQAFAVRPEVGRELVEQVDPDAPSPTQRRASEGVVGDAHALAMPMRARLGARSSAQYVGVISIARRGREFSRAESKLLEYLAGQAVVSIENSDMHETVQHQAVTDELTGLANVRQLHGVLDNEIERARRFGHPLGLVMLDVDDFKQVNDSYGHQQGDQVLAAVAVVLRDLSRDIDQPARYGGEEMAVVLPQTDIEGAVQLAERMRETVEQLQLPRLDGKGQLRVTVSFGVASIPYSAADKEHLIATADAALYRAKRAGKNRVEVAEPVAAAN